jgi:hypothetical protein
MVAGVFRPDRRGERERPFKLGKRQLSTISARNPPFRSRPISTFGKVRIAPVPAAHGMLVASRKRRLGWYTRSTGMRARKGAFKVSMGELHDSEIDHSSSAGPLPPWVLVV